MDLQFYGANCVTLALKNTRVIVDDNLQDLGGKTVTKAGDIALFTGIHGVPKAETKILIDMPGEYEVSDVSIVGIPARAHMDEPGKLSATIYKVTIGDIDAVIMGHIYPELSDRQLEAIGMVDLMIVPVGGSGYTLDPLGALKLIKAVEPKLVVPTHYADTALQFPVPQAELATALHELAMEPKETTTKLRVKPTELSDATQLVLVEKS